MKTTMRDIAKHANASVSTVSRVLTGKGYVSEDMYAHIMKVCRELNYSYERPQMRNGKKDRIIGVIISDLQNDYNVHIISGIQEVADLNGYEVLITDTRGSLEREEQALRMFMTMALSGIIFTPIMHKHMLSSGLYYDIERENIPIVIAENDLEYSNYDAVFTNNVLGAHDAVSAFVECGHRKIATIIGPETSKAGRERLTGYKKGLHLASISVVDEYVQQGHFTATGGYEAMRRLMQLQDRPTAVFVANGIMVRGCYKYLIDHFGDPKRVSIITYDDLPNNVFSIPVSVVAQPMKEMGEISMKTLLERIAQFPHKRREIKRIILSPKLILKGSEKPFSEHA